jgi:hypothetical protein
LLGDKGYPLVNWIMTLFKKNGHHTIFKLLYKRKHKKGHSIVENYFGILKKTFKELMQKLKLNVIFLLNVFICLLHNLFKYEDDMNIDRLFWTIGLEENPHEKQQIFFVVANQNACNKIHIESQKKFGKMFQFKIYLFTFEDK